MSALNTKYMHLLIIEDEPKMAEYLYKGLTENNFIVDIATDGEEGLYLAANNSYNLILLDVMLPKIDGWSIITTLRSQKKDTPVLFLTARDSISDRVKGLELGADDYLIKPFSFSELLARIRTVLRRGAITMPDVLEVADLKIDLIRRKASRGRKQLDLTPKEFALLSLLMRRIGEVVSRTVITEQIWDMNFDSDTNVVDVVIRRLRQKVDDSFTSKLIHTIRGVGYVLEVRDEN